jgi:hypothetical protein
MPPATGTPARFWPQAGRTLARTMAGNHILWGIALGFVLSLSTAHKYLDPGNPPVKPNGDFAKETGFFDQVRVAPRACACLVACASAVPA